MSPRRAFALAAILAAAPVLAAVAANPTPKTIIVAMMLLTAILVNAMTTKWEILGAR